MQGTFGFKLDFELLLALGLAVVFGTALSSRSTHAFACPGCSEKHTPDTTTYTYYFGILLVRPCFKVRLMIARCPSAPVSAETEQHARPIRADRDNFRRCRQNSFA